MSLLTLLVLFVRFEYVLVDPSYDMAGNRCERLPVAWQVLFQLSPFEPTSFGSLPEILGWIQEVSQPRLQKKQVKIQRGGAVSVKGWNFDLRTLLRINSN